MSLNTQASTTARNDALNGLASDFNNGYLRIYSGSQPANADAATTGTKLAELRFGATAFGGAASGVLTANAITQDSNAPNTGTAGYFRIFKSDGTTVLMDGSIGTSSSFNLNISTTSIVAGNVVQCSSFTITLPGAGS